MPASRRFRRHRRPVPLLLAALLFAAPGAVSSQQDPYRTTERARELLDRVRACTDSGCLIQETAGFPMDTCERGAWHVGHGMVLDCEAVLVMVRYEFHGIDAAECTPADATIALEYLLTDEGRLWRWRPIPPGSGPSLYLLTTAIYGGVTYRASMLQAEHVWHHFDDRCKLVDSGRMEISSLPQNLPLTLVRDLYGSDFHWLDFPLDFNSGYQSLTEYQQETAVDLEAAGLHFARSDLDGLFEGKAAWKTGSWTTSEDVEERYVVDVHLRPQPYRYSAPQDQAARRE